MSCVIFYTSYVVCHMSSVTFYYCFFLLFFFGWKGRDKVIKLVVDGVLSTGGTPSSLQTRCSRGFSTNTPLLLINSFTDPIPSNLLNIIYPKPLKLGTWNFETMFTTPCLSRDKCYVSPVTCFVSCVTCLVSHDIIIS